MYKQNDKVILENELLRTKCIDVNISSTRYVIARFGWPRRELKAVDKKGRGGKVFI